MAARGAGKAGGASTGGRAGSCWPHPAAIVLLMTLLPAAPAIADAGGVTSASAQAVPDTVMQLPLVDGGRLSALYCAPAHPRAAIVMLSGGAGDIGLQPDGSLRHGDNFVVRTRALWTARGYAIAIPDTVDHADLRGRRSTRDYASRIQALVEAVHERAGVPVFVLGTSQGSIGAMNLAARAQAGTLAGLVLTESVSRPGRSHETVFDADPGDVRVPALVVANRDDACDVAPPGDAARIAAALRASPGVRVLEVSGGRSASARACDPLTPHGYYGIEEPVVQDIDAWMRAQP